MSRNKSKQINQAVIYLLLSAITILALFLRFYKLGEWSFWIDELFTIRDAFNHNTISIQDVYLIDPQQDYGFSFFSISLILVRGVLTTFGITEFNARIIPALLGSLSIPIFFLPLRKMIGSKVALVAVFFLAISPWHMFLSQNARYYAPLIIFATLSLFAFYFSLEKNNPLYLILSLFFLVLATFERIHSLFFLPVVGIYIILLVFLPFGKKPAGLTRKNIALVIGIPVLIYLFYEVLYHFVLQRETFIQVFLSPKFLGQITARPQWLITGVITDVGVPLAVLAVIGGGSLLMRRNRLGLLLILAIVIPMIALMVLAPFFQTSIHYMIVSLPAWMILGAVGFVELYHQTQKKWGLPLMVGTLLLIGGLFLRDRVIRDVLYFYGPQLNASIITIAGLGVALLGGAGVLLVSLSVFHRQNSSSLPDSARDYPATISKPWVAVIRNLPLVVWGLIILPILLLHPMVTNHLYYTFQHGYRDNNWKAAVSSLASYKEDGDFVLSAMPPVASYYLGERVQDLDGFRIEEALTSGQRFWVIEEYGAYQIQGDEFQNWITENCQRVSAFDRYVRGREWPMRIAICPPDSSMSRIDHTVLWTTN
jgi:4-amino-4-deoxy-L-arabinose transferase-like glycosyltransferase